MKLESISKRTLILRQVQRDRPGPRELKDNWVRLGRPAARDIRGKRGRMDPQERQAAADRLEHPAPQDQWETKARVVSLCVWVRRGLFVFGACVLSRLFWCRPLRSL